MDGCVVREVVSGSIGEELEVVPGDIILEINGVKVHDVLDYKFLSNDGYIEVEVYNEAEGPMTLEIEKEPGEDLGLIFDSYLMDDPKPCKNKCIFCFIDQLPKEMRKTLYFKDDDYRLSYLTGNYVTLTNTSVWEIDRIINYKLSPVNISIHTTDIELRKKMLRHKENDNLMDVISNLHNNGIEMNGQIVLCKGYNDKDHLDKTLDDLTQFIPSMKSVSIVPVGLTKHRRSLEQIEPYSEEDCELLVHQVSEKQKIYKKKYNTNFIYLSDEIYIKAGLELPKYKEYEEFPQLENGVGMVSLFEREFNTYLAKKKGDDKKREVSIATGELAKAFIQSLCEKITYKFINTKINVIVIKNDFFGELITVSGLITAKDIIGQLKGKELGSVLLIPKNMLRKDTDMFLDNLEIKDIQKALNIQTEAVDTTGTAFIKSIINVYENKGRKLTK